MRNVAWRQICCRHLKPHSHPHQSTRAIQHFSHGSFVHRVSASSGSYQLGLRLRWITTRASRDKTFFNYEYGSSDNGQSESDSQSQSQSEEAILQRAKVHGIETLTQLAYEADLGPNRRKGQRLIQTPSARKDLDLWATLLDYRRFADGDAGIKDVLDEMIFGDQQFKFESDIVSRQIWQTILPVILDNEHLLHTVSETGSLMIRDLPHVFIDVVGRLLAAGDIRLAIIAATQLLSSHFRGREDLLELFDIALRSESEDAIPAFCRLISRLPLHRIYSHVMPKLWEASRTRDAFFVHRHLLSMGDLPTQFEHLEPFVREIAVRKLKIEPFVRNLESSGAFFIHQVQKFHSQELLRLALESKRSTDFMMHQGPGTRPVKLSDAFVARTFATRTVSFEFIINGLQFIGLFELGPLAVREIAMGAEDIDMLRERFQRIEQMQVDLGSSNYVRVIQRLCFSGQKNMLQAVLDSDMHYEVFEDVQKQKRLLAEYYQAKNWPEVNRTLAILNEGQTGREADVRSANFLLQVTLVIGDWRGALVELDKLRLLGVQSHSELAPFRQALKRIWTDVDNEQREMTEYINRSEYLVGFMQLAHAAGLRPHPWQWRVVLQAVGRSRDWDLFESLTLSVARMFTARTNDEMPSECDNSDVDVVNALFDENVQTLIIESSLMTNVTNDGEYDAADVWTRGLDLLEQLKYRFNLRIVYDDLVVAFRSRLEDLFDDPDVGVRQRFADAYLRYLSWAWRQIDIRDDRISPRSLIQRGWTQPDLNSLKLFRFRVNSVRERIRPLEMETPESPYLNGSGRTSVQRKRVIESYRPGRDTTTNKYPRQGVEDTAVFYEDLFHPSYTHKKKGI